jgi:TolB-like protein/Flp pilus assembly protein TadD
MIAAPVMILLLGTLVWWSLAGRRRQAIDSLAVLPLLIVSNDADAEYMSDGITDIIINNLSQLPQLRVMARGTVFTYKGKQVDPRQVGRELGVRAVLTGRVVQRGDSLSVQVDLADAATGSQLWGERYDRTLAELAIVEAEIARRISEKLLLTMTGEEQQRLTKHHTENPEAHQLYLKGRYYTSKATIDGFRKGIGYMNQAIELDPTYALAYAGLAGYYYEASGTYQQPQEAIPKARAAALQALKLDETLAEAHTALALVKAQYDWNWAEAEKEYRRAIELNPSYAPAHQYYGYCLAEQERLDEAIAEMTRAHELDPLTPWISTNLAWFYYLARRYEESAAQYLKIIEADPGYANAHYSLGLVYAQKKMFEQAIAETEKARQLDPDKPNILAQLGHIYSVSGKKAEAQRVLDELLEKEKSGYVNPVYVATVYTGLGEKDQTFAWLEKAYQDRSEELLFLKVDPAFNDLHSDPRFVGLLRRMNLAL